MSLEHKSQIQKPKVKSKSDMKQKWADFLFNVMETDEEEYVITVDELWCEDFAGLQELEDYGINPKKVEIVLRLKQEASQ